MTNSNEFLRYFQAACYLGVARVARIINARMKYSGSPIFRPKLVHAPEAGNAISLSPHPDDDILAVGGTLAGHAQSKCKVVSIVLTDGACGTGTAEQNDELVAVRRKETENAARLIGITDLRFWNQPDGKLHPNSDFIISLRDLIRFYEPAFIYVPFPLDYHFDHLAAVDLLLQTLKGLPQPPMIRCYECIIPLIPNIISDITPLIEIKRQAVACFVSQNRVSNYQNTIVDGLNRLRSHGLMAGEGWGEGIFETDWGILEKIFRAIR